MSSMSNKIEYFEKYSVAPPPSRDYYGIKVLGDKIILYLWRISHGPHKAPVVRSVEFSDFDRDYTLQDEIFHGFGEHLLKHIKDIIASRGNTLLTLPKSLIGQISKYLTFDDIIRLSSLSHSAREVFDTNSVWQELYKRYHKGSISVYEAKQVMAYGWKPLFKEQQIQSVMRQKAAKNRFGIKHDLPRFKQENKTTNSFTDIPISVSSMDLKIKKPSDKFHRNVNDQTEQTFLKKSSISRPKPTFEQLQESIRRSSEKKNEPVQNNNLKNIKSVKSLTTIEKEKYTPNRSESRPVKSANSERSSERNKSTKNHTNTDASRNSVSKGKYTIKDKNLDIKTNEIKSIDRLNETQKGTGGSKSLVRSANHKSINPKPNPSIKNNTVSNKGKVMSNNFQSNQAKSNDVPKKKIKGKLHHQKKSIISTDAELLKDAAFVKNDITVLQDLIDASYKRNVSGSNDIMDYIDSLMATKYNTEDFTSFDTFKNKKKVSRGSAVLDRVSEKSESEKSEVINTKSVESLASSKLDSPRFAAKHTRARIDKLKQNLEIDKESNTDSRKKLDNTYNKHGEDIGNKNSNYNKFLNSANTDMTELKIPISRNVNNILKSKNVDIYKKK